MTVTITKNKNQPINKKILYSINFSFVSIRAVLISFCSVDSFLLKRSKDVSALCETNLVIDRYQCIFCSLISYFCRKDSKIYLSFVCNHLLCPKMRFSCTSDYFYFTLLLLTIFHFLFGFLSSQDCDIF